MACFAADWVGWPGEFLGHEGQAQEAGRAGDRRQPAARRPRRRGRRLRLLAPLPRRPGDGDRAGHAARTTAPGSAGPVAPRPTSSRSSRTACRWCRWRWPRTRSEEFYEGFSNATLWPLYHDVVAKPEFHREWWDSYVRVNQRFAEKAAEVAADEATVWVHDYQMQLVPAMLRELRPDLRIGFFLHIPFPPAELFQQLPWRRQLLEGLLGADVVGFQRPGAVAELRAAGASAGRAQDAPRRDLPARRPGRAGRVVPDLHRHLAGSTSWPARRPSSSAARRSASSSATPGSLLLGIDRLDYTKGIYDRLRAFGELIEHR